MASKQNKKKAADSEEKAAKRKARMEALKNRPAGQRTNSKQIDVIQIGENQEVRTYGYPIKVKHHSIGVMITSVVVSEGKTVSCSTSWIPGELAVKAKKGHGTLVAQKIKKGKKGAEDVEDDEDENESED